MTYSKELRDRIEQNLRMFDYPRFDDGDIDALLDEIERLQAERRWIPVSERLPEYGEPSLTIYHTKNATSQITIRCLVEDRDDKLRVIWYDIENGLWVNGNNITHWMPLPEPPEEK